ncbi:hypothetical protein AYI69_g11085 [Smittium culicis]|uniref:Uncharacterized protein n=1 Tax=Smittium culicis TaxID=133412 RepID=A0A1R1X179_9FUNG|nr:hypothetical protein AYI69_g11085 [Smittium culicis]
MYKPSIVFFVAGLLLVASAIPFDINRVQGVDMYGKQVGEQMSQEIMENLGSLSDLYGEEYELLARRWRRRRGYGTSINVAAKQPVAQSSAPVEQKKSDDDEESNGSNEVSNADKRAHAVLPKVFPALV